MQVVSSVLVVKQMGLLVSATILRILDAVSYRVDASKSTTGCILATYHQFTCLK